MHIINIYKLIINKKYTFINHFSLNFLNFISADMKEGQDRTLKSDEDRLSVFQMRNSLCKPHLKSSYPAETQFHPLGLTEEDIKVRIFIK